MNTLGEALHCFALAMREAMRPALLIWSVLLVCGVLLFWTVVWIFFGGEIRDAILGASQWAIEALFYSQGSAPQHGFSYWLVNILQWFNSLFSYVLWFLTYLLCVLLSLRLLLELLLMGRIQAQCLISYPQLSAGVKTSYLRVMLDALWMLLLSLGLTILCLLLPVVGGVLLFIGLSYLNIRSLVNDALDGLASSAQRRALIRQHRMSMLWLGMLISVWMFIPLLGLIGPLLMGAGACHLLMRALVAQQRQPIEGAHR